MPLALLTALLVKAPAVGIEDTKLPKILQIPKVRISWDAFTPELVAEIRQSKLQKYSFENQFLGFIHIYFVCRL